MKINKSEIHKSKIEILKNDFSKFRCYNLPKAYSKK